MLCALHNHIAHMREKETGDPFLLAILGNAVTATGVDTGDKDSIKPFELGTDGFEAITVIMEFFGDMVKALQRLALDDAETSFIQIAAIDEDGFHRRVILKIKPVAVIREGSLDKKLQEKQ